jgi:nucleotide-binding universal stress UspA family protein
MKTILVPVGGSDTDAAAFETALTVARQLTGHLEFLHVRVGRADAVLNTPHIEFARGAALAHAIDDLEQRSQARAVAAERHVREFCAREGIELVDAPRSPKTVSARWREEQGDALPRLLFHARHNDLVVMARSSESDGLPPSRLETLLIESGRPLLIAPAKPRAAALATIAVCWKEAAQSARALAAALPLLRSARRVVIVSVREGDVNCAPEDALADLVRQLAWQGIAAEPHVVSPDGRSTAKALLCAARDQRADMVVMGAYGHWHLREIVFGGCTQTVIEGEELPVLLAH